jgi:YVTN family beta-propeller protein
VYVTNQEGTVSVIATATNTVAATIRVGNRPYGVAITPDGAKLYVTNQEGTVSVIAMATNTVSHRHDTGRQPPLWRGGHPGWGQGLCREQ